MTGKPPDISPAWTRQYLAVRPVPCPVCSAPLKDTDGVRCPACRVELTLGFSSTEPYLRIWAVVLGLLSIGGGVGMLLVILLTARGIDGIRNSVLPGILSFVAMIPMPLAALVFRRRFCRLRPAFQKVLLLLAFLITAWSAISLLVGIAS